MKKTLMLWAVALCTLSTYTAAEDDLQNSQKQEVSIPSQEDVSNTAADQIPLMTPRIFAPEAVEVGKKVIFDASGSDFPEGALFSWELGDGNMTQEYPEIVHTYSETGEFEVTLTLEHQGQIIRTRQKIFVFDAKAVLLTTDDIFTENQQIQEQAIQNGVFLKTIALKEDASQVILEEKFLQLLQENKDSLYDADILLFWTSSSLGIQAFTRFWQSLEADKKISFDEKMLIRITDRSIKVTAATLQQAFEVLHPSSFLLTRKEALYPIFQAKKENVIHAVLEKRGIEYQIIDETSGPPIFLLLTTIITGFLSQGIPASTIFLLLSFPFIAFFVAFFRQVVGLSTYGVFIPIMLALAFQILTLKFSLLVLVVIIALSSFLRIVFQRLDILYIPRAALMLSAIALSFLSVIWFALRFNTQVSITLAVFPMLVMSMMSEKFLSAQSEEGMNGALLGAVETIIVAIISFLFISTNFFKELLLSLPELIAIPLLGIVLLGKFTGLRISEYFRFRALLREGGEEE